MKTTLKIISKILSAILICTINFPLAPWMVGGEEKYFSDWDQNIEYDPQTDAINLEKDPNKDFVILNLTDIQLNDNEFNASEGDIAYYTMDYLVEKNQPDLITLTGDNAWGKEAYVSLIKKLESYNIPYAPIMGNHDGQLTYKTYNGSYKNIIDEFWCAYKLAKGKNSLFKFGPKDMGYGNYIINITENGNIIHTLYMLDTHSDSDKIADSYDHLWDNQIEYYKWAVEGTNKFAEKNVESTVLFHIPVPEYENAAKTAFDFEKQQYLNGHEHDEFCYINEPICAPKFQNGFFNVCKDLDSTKTIIVGHDHVNCFNINYEGINLVYAMKTGPGCYSDLSLMNGGTLIKISSDGKAKVSFDRVDINLMPHD